MISTRLRPVAYVTAAALALGGAFYAGAAYAADPKLDLAKDSIQKAIALLKAADEPGSTKDYGGHRASAVKNLNQALRDVDKAKAFADRPHPKK
ncbi:MAG: hypothetical protein IT374_23855 [Polyangiaceae bacterium]|nr:hypothetical protein [Polyangiaceae bacterium]